MSVKAKGWKRVRLTLFWLLGFLALLGFFWDTVPKTVSNVGKLVETIATSPRETVEDIKKNYQFFVFLFSMFVICMGMTRWAGKRLWYDQKISRRKELKLPVASLFSPGSSASSSFTYWSLFQGGFIGLGLVSWLLLYGLIGADKDQDVLQGFAKGLESAIVMLCSLSLVQFLDGEGIWSRQHFTMVINSPVLIIVSAFLIVIIVISGFVGVILALQTSSSLLVQILLVVILSLCFSYIYGLREGLKAADPEPTYPLVTVDVIQGTGFDEAWLYERTDSDYRLVTKSGSNHIIPASNVKQITGL
jgi:hypothetical protein